MSNETLQRRAEAAGVAPRWRDAFGVEREVPPETLRRVLDRLEADGAPAGAQLPPLLTADAGAATWLPVPHGRHRLITEDGPARDVEMTDAGGGLSLLPPIETIGYHRLDLADGRAVTVAVAPAALHATVDFGRAWGFAVQLYSLRGAVDGGIGDTAALVEFARAAGAHGASAIAISPLHAQFSADPDRFSPYAPSSRIMLNVLHAPLPDGIALGHVPTGGLIDWPLVARARLNAFRRAFDASDQVASDPGFVAFRAAQGDALERHARFEALHAAIFGRNPAQWHWRTWPAELRHPTGPAVAAFARDHAREVAFHAWLQYRADQGLAAAQDATRQAGMSIGLIADLAVGTDSGGSHAWSRQGEMLTGFTVGAPPDQLSPGGQDWGLVTFSPHGLRQRGYAAFIEMLRAALRHAGGVRVDHALGLERLWVLPEGAAANDGAYLTMPRDDLLRLLALEGARHGALLIGEDLGTLPEGFRERLQSHGVQGLRVLYFERAEDQGFIAPSHWSRQAVAMTSTHDVPTIAGWWTEHDLDLRSGLGLVRDLAAERAARAVDRERLWSAMVASASTAGPPPPRDMPEKVVDAAIAHTARAACDLLLLPMEDAIGTVEQPNLPGTYEQHPNWRRRLPERAERLLSAPAVARRLAAIRAARGGA